MHATLCMSLVAKGAWSCSREFWQCSARSLSLAFLQFSVCSAMLVRLDHPCDRLLKVVADIVASRFFSDPHGASHE